MLIATQPHPRSGRQPIADLGKAVSLRQALAHLAERRPQAVLLRKRRVKP